jgi:hypothetical protein
MDRLSNSQLRTSLVWGVDPAEGLFPEAHLEPPPVVGRIPPQWRALERATHLNAYYARIVDCVRRPVEVEVRPGVRRVSVLGQAVFEFDRIGFVRVFMWSWRGDEFDCFAQPPERISIGETPYGWTWLELFRQGFVAELAFRLGRGPEELQSYSQWVFARLGRKLAAVCDLRSMRERVAVALALDPLAVQVARRIRLACRLRPKATLREYNHAIAHLPAYRKLQKESPNLVPLYAAHAHLASLEPGEPAQQLKRYLMEAYGLRQATWALVHGTRPRWLYLIEHFYQASPATATADLLMLVQALGCRRMPPRWYLWNLLQVFGHHGDRTNEYSRHYATRLRAVRRLTAVIEAADDAHQAGMRARIYDVLAWIVADYAHLMRGISRAGWKWFVGHADAWRRRREEAAAAMIGQWAAPFDAFRSGEYTVCVLRTHEELIREARAMRHCVDSYADQCAKGGHLVVSIRRADRERPIATAHLKHVRQRWRVVHVAGAANSVPRPAGFRLAFDACARINALGWHCPGPDAKRPVGARACDEGAGIGSLDAPDGGLSIQERA